MQPEIEALTLEKLGNVEIIFGRGLIRICSIPVSLVLSK